MLSLVLSVRTIQPFRNASSTLYLYDMRNEELRLTKKVLLKSMKELPDEFTIDELMERLVVLQKIERGLKEMSEGKGLTTDQARKRLARWLS